MAWAPIQNYILSGNGGNGDRWFDVLGWVAYYFAHLEWISYEVIDRLGTAENKAHARLAGRDGMDFTARTILAKKLMKSHLSTSDANLAREWETFWKDAIAAASMRNDILHNPLTVTLHGMQSVGDTEGIRLMKKTGEPLLELGEVQVYANGLMKLNELMLDLFKRTTFP